MKVKVKKLYETVKLPDYKTKGAAARDIYSLTGAVIQPGNTATIRTGLAMEVPEGFVLLLLPRSSCTDYDVNLANDVGVIDSDYRGEIKIKLKNNGRNTFEAIPGERYVQALLLPAIFFHLHEVDELTPTERGEGSFGSTGRF